MNNFLSAFLMWSSPRIESAHDFRCCLTGDVGGAERRSLALLAKTEVPAVVWKEFYKYANFVDTSVFFLEGFYSRFTSAFPIYKSRRRRLLLLIKRGEHRNRRKTPTLPKLAPVVATGSGTLNRRSDFDTVSLLGLLAKIKV